MVDRDFLKTRHRLIPGLEYVTLTRLKTGGTVSSVEAERRPLNRNVSGQSDLSSDELEFVLADVTCGGTAPKAGDTITDSASVVYGILSVNTELLTTRHRCRVVKQR